MVKGVIHILEATIAAVVILSSIFYLYTPVQSTPEAALQELGYSCLKQIDSSGRLAMYAEGNDEAGLKLELGSCIPAVAGYEARICETEQCSATVPDDRTVVSVVYFSSGYMVPDSAQISLWMWSR